MLLVAGSRGIQQAHVTLGNPPARPNNSAPSVRVRLIRGRPDTEDTRAFGHDSHVRIRAASGESSESEPGGEDDPHRNSQHSAHTHAPATYAREQAFGSDKPNVGSGDLMGRPDRVSMAIHDQVGSQVRRSTLGTQEDPAPRTGSTRLSSI